MSIKILIADDHEVVRQGIRTILQVRSDWEICGEASNGAEAVRLAQDIQPDAIIMDLNMPVLNGFEATRQITKLGVRAPVLVFTMHEARNLGDSVRQVGARGFVFKSRAGSDLIEALERLLEGGTYFPTPDETPAQEKKGPDVSFLRRQALSLSFA